MKILDEEQKRRLLLMLHRLTQEDKLIWDATSSPFVFRTESGRFAYTITSRDEDDFAPYDIRVFDKNLKDSRAFETFGTDEFFELNEEIQQIYVLVKRKILGLDTVVDDLFGELNSRLDGPF